LLFVKCVSVTQSTFTYGQYPKSVILTFGPDNGANNKGARTTLSPVTLRSFRPRFKLHVVIASIVCSVFRIFYRVVLFVFRAGFAFEVRVLLSPCESIPSTISTFGFAAIDSTSKPALSFPRSLRLRLFGCVSACLAGHSMLVLGFLRSTGIHAFASYRFLNCQTYNL
jgi:hypothetical protein